MHKSDSTCIAILGESRSGKTRILEHFEMKHQATRTSGGLITPIVKIKVHSKPTVKSLAQELLYSLGDEMYDKGTEYDKTIRLRRLLSAAKTKVIMLDEFQHFYDQGSRKVQYSVADWLKNLIDETRIGLVVAGLTTSISVIKSNVQLVRRFHKPIELKRFDWFNNNEKNEFRNILHTIQEALEPLSFPDLSSNDLAFRIYIATDGLMGYVIKLFREVAINVINNGRLTVTLDDLYVAYKLTIWDTFNQSTNPFSKSFNTGPTTMAHRDISRLNDVTTDISGKPLKGVAPY